MVNHPDSLYGHPWQSLTTPDSLYNNSLYGNTPDSLYDNTPDSLYGNTPDSLYGNTPDSLYGNTPDSLYGKLGIYENPDSLYSRLAAPTVLVAAQAVTKGC